MVMEIIFFPICDFSLLCVNFCLWMRNGVIVTCTNEYMAFLLSLFYLVLSFFQHSNFFLSIPGVECADRREKKHKFTARRIDAQHQRVRQKLHRTLLLLYTQKVGCCCHCTNQQSKSTEKKKHERINVYKIRKEVIFQMTYAQFDFVTSSQFSRSLISSIGWFVIVACIVVDSHFSIFHLRAFQFKLISSLFCESIEVKTTEQNGLWHRRQKFDILIFGFGEKLLRQLSHRQTNSIQYDYCKWIVLEALNQCILFFVFVVQMRFILCAALAVYSVPFRIMWIH